MGQLFLRDSLGVVERLRGFSMLTAGRTIQSGRVGKTSELLLNPSLLRAEHFAGT